MTLSGGSGVAMSMSSTGRWSTASRTQPPTKRTSAPSAARASTTATVSGAAIHGWGATLPVGSGTHLLSPASRPPGAII